MNRAAIPIVLVGLGLMGRRMLGWFAGHHAYRVLAAFDPDDQAWHCAAEEGLPSPERANDLASLLKAPGARVVCIATPPASHLSIARAAMKAGLAIFCEKPLAVDVRSASRFVRDAEERDVRAAVNFPFATMPALYTFRDQVESGAIGSLVRTDILLHFSAWPRTWHHAGPWLARREEGGFLREVFSHFAFLTQRVIGDSRWKIDHVTLHRGRAPGAEEMVQASLRLGDHPVNVSGGVAAGAPDRIEWTLYGTDGALRLVDWAVAERSDGAEWIMIHDERDRPRRGDRQLDALQERIETGEGPLATLREALDVQRLVEGMLLW